MAEQPPLTLKRWRRVEYQRLVELGAFDNEPIVNLVDRVVEVYREPTADVTAPYGWRYHSLSRIARPRDVTLLGAPTVRIPVAAPLP
jgi:hypothetical protein